MTIKKKNEIYIEKAIKLAEKSTMLKKHGCIIVKNNKILGEGYNKRINTMKNMYSIHAEISAIQDAKKHLKDIKDSTLYVVRINNENILDKSCPCIKCKNAILSNNISKIYYS